MIILAILNKYKEDYLEIFDYSVSQIYTKNFIIIYEWKDKES